MHRLINTFVLLLISGFLIAQEKPDPYDQVWEAVEKKNFRKAHMLVDQLLEKNPEDLIAFVLKGDVYLEQSQLLLAKTHFENGLAKFPRNAEFFNRRANFYKSVLEFDHAIRDMDRAMELAESDTIYNMYLANRGVAKLEKRDFHSAYDDLIKAYEFDSTNIMVLTNLGALVDEIGRPEETFYYLEKVIEIQPDFAPAYGNIGFRHQVMGNHEEAIRYFDKVLELSPEDPLGYNNRSYSKMKLGDLKAAMKDVQKSLEIYPTNAYAFRNRALIYLEMKKKDKACADLHEAERLGFYKMYGSEVRKLLVLNCMDYKAK